MLLRIRSIIADWFGPERDAKNYERDSRWVIEKMEMTYQSEMRERIAVLTRENLRDCHAAVAGRSDRRPQIMSEIQRQHREARGRHEMALWTALTLVVIYLKSEDIDELGAPARANINEFLAQWRHTEGSSPANPGHPPSGS